MGIDHKWFESYLSSRRQIVRVNGTCSDTCDVVNGVPQGSLLGPLLYLCYCNDMQISMNAKLLLYADDAIILVSGKDPILISHNLSVEVTSCDKWLIDNKLSMHPGKCECIIFCSKRRRKNVQNFSVTWNGNVLTSTPTVRYLGSTVDQCLSGQDNVSNIIQKSNGKLKFLYRYSKFLNRSTRRILCTALIQSHLDYACMSWYFGISAFLKYKLQVIQNKRVRFIL
jgi:ribonuclease P/MRP protein subunit RPP40